MLSQPQPPGLELFHDLVHTLNATLDLDRVLAHVIDQVNEFLCIEATSVSLLDAESKELVIRMTIGKAADPQPGLRLPPYAGIAGWVVHHGEAVRIADAQQDDRFYPAVDQLTGFTTRAMLCVPLRIQGHSIGVIQAINSRAGVFSPADLCFMMTLADVAALAIENARLYGVEQQMVRQATTWRMIADVLGDLVDWREGLSAALGHLPEIVACDGAAVLLIGPDRVVASDTGPGESVCLARQQCLRSISVWGKDEPAAHEACWPIQDLPFYRHMLASGNPLAVIDVQQDDRYVALWPKEQVYSWLGVPLIAQDQTLGFVCLDRSRVDEFVHQDIHTAQIFAGQVARALANLQVYRTTQERAAQLTILGEVLLAAVPPRQVDVPWEQIVDRLVELLAVRGAGIALLDEAGERLDFCVLRALVPALAHAVQCAPVKPDMVSHPVIVRQQIVLLPAEPSGSQDASAGAGLLLPIHGAEGVVGLLVLEEQSPDLPSAARLSLLQAVADQIGVLVDRWGAPPSA